MCSRSFLQPVWLVAIGSYSVLIPSGTLFQVMVTVNRGTCMPATVRMHGSDCKRSIVILYDFRGIQRQLDGIIFFF